MNISKNIWNEVLDILNKYNIPYTTHYESRDIKNEMEYQDATVQDKHIQINLVIPDYFEEEMQADSNE